LSHCGISKLEGGSDRPDTSDRAMTRSGYGALEHGAVRDRTVQLPSATNHEVTTKDLKAVLARVLWV